MRSLTLLLSLVFLMVTKAFAADSAGAKANKLKRDLAKIQSRLQDLNQATMISPGSEKKKLLRGNGRKLDETDEPDEDDLPSEDDFGGDELALYSIIQMLHGVSDTTEGIAHLLTAILLDIHDGDYDGDDFIEGDDLFEGNGTVRTRY